MANQKSSVKQYIVLDTNILQYIGDKKLAPYILSYLLELVNRGFGFTISQITIYELLAGAPVQKETGLAKILDKFVKKEINEEVLITAAQLTTLYNMEKIPKEMTSTEDKIIAATVILTGSLILTGDCNDFPRPYFKEAEERLIHFRKKNKTHMIPLYLFAPNIPVITQRFKERPN